MNIAQLISEAAAMFMFETVVNDKSVVSPQHNFFFGKFRLSFCMNDFSVHVVYITITQHINCDFFFVEHSFVVVLDVLSALYSCEAGGRNERELYNFPIALGMIIIIYKI